MTLGRAFDGSKIATGKADPLARPGFQQLRAPSHLGIRTELKPWKAHLCVQHVWVKSRSQRRSLRVFVTEPEWFEILLGWMDPPK